MGLRRLVAAGLWLAATAAATAMVWTAVSVVAADVTDRPAPVIAQREVVVALQTGELAGGPAPSTTTPRASTTTSTTRPRGPAPVVAAPTPPTSAPLPPAPPPAPTTTTSVPFPPVTTATTPPTSPPTAPPPTTPPPSPTATYPTTGGAVTVTCSGYFIRLVSATPTDGYAAEVLDRGPATVDVHFVRPGDEVRVRVACLAGRPTRIPDQHQAPSSTSVRRPASRSSGATDGWPRIRGEFARA